MIGAYFVIKNRVQRRQLRAYGKDGALGIHIIHICVFTQLIEEDRVRAHRMRIAFRIEPDAVRQTNARRADIMRDQMWILLAEIASGFRDDENEIAASCV